MILIEPDAYVPRSALPKRELSRFLMDACERVGLVGEVTVLVTTDERMRELNRTFRRKNKPTDVLSFPAGPPAFAGQEVSGGDLAISVDTARRQAESLGHALLVEVEILVLHGLLHLSGMDHEQDTGQMGRREAKLRREFGLPAGLIQRSAKAVVVPTSAKRDVGHPGSSSRNRDAVPVRRTGKKRRLRPGHTRDELCLDHPHLPAAGAADARLLCGQALLRDGQVSLSRVSGEYRRLGAAH